MSSYFKAASDYLKNSLKDYFKTASNSYRPVLSDLRQFAVNQFQSVKDKPFSYKNIAKYVGLGVAAAGLFLLTGSAVGAAAGAFGLASLAVNYRATQYKDHNNILAPASIALALGLVEQAIYFGLTGGLSLIPGIVMLSHALLTTAAFSVIPEDQKMLRKVITLAGGAIGAALAGYAAFEFSDLTEGLAATIAPYFLAATTALNAFVFGIGTDKTERARLAYIGLNMAHAAYWLTQPVFSVGLFLTEFLFIYGHTKSLIEHDVPMTDPVDGERKLTSKERWSVYWSKVRHGRHEEDASKSRHDLGIKVLPNL